MSIEMAMFKAEMVAYMEKIEARCKALGLPMNKITLLLRDSGNDEMIVLLSNETLEGLDKAYHLAVKKPVA